MLQKKYFVVDGSSKTEVESYEKLVEMASEVIAGAQNSKIGCLADIKLRSYTDWNAYVVNVCLYIKRFHNSAAA